jgi:hypothetical protein
MLCMLMYTYSMNIVQIYCTHYSVPYFVQHEQAGEYFNDKECLVLYCNSYRLLRFYAPTVYSHTTL